MTLLSRKEQGGWCFCAALLAASLMTGCHPSVEGKSPTASQHGAAVSAQQAIPPGVAALQQQRGSAMAKAMERRSHLLAEKRAGK